MSSTDPNLGLNYGWTLGESGWDTGMDANLKRLGAVVGLSVKDRDLDHATGQPLPTATVTSFLPLPRACGQAKPTRSRCALPMPGSTTSPKIGWLCYIEDEAKLSAYKPTGWSAGIAI